MHGKNRVTKGTGLLLEDLFSHPSDTYIFLERYVNKGSPSGYHAAEGISWEYHPKNPNQSFALPLLRFNTKQVTVDTHGSIPTELKCSDSVLYPCHPSIINRLKECGISFEIAKQIPVAPTASVRTVISLQTGLHIKLSLDTNIGRFNRRITRTKWLASFENNEEMIKNIDLLRSPKQFAIMRENAGIFVESKLHRELRDGVILRSPQPYPSCDQSTLIPFFSLFPNDPAHKQHEPLLVQLLKLQSDPLEYLMEAVVFPLLRCYGFQAIQIGMIPENNAQNLLLEIDSRTLETRIVHRDMMGTFKDLMLRQQLGLSVDFQAYHSTDIEDGMLDTFRRRSFGYDFKNGEYVLAEIENLLTEFFNISRSNFRNAVKESFPTLVTSDIEGYFGSGNEWWSYKKVIPSNSDERPYVKNQYPKYR